MAPPAVLVVDSDLGFIVALSYELHLRGIEALPAITVTEAQPMLSGLPSLDVLVINCAISGACTFAEQVVYSRPNVRIIGIISEANDCKNCEDLLTARLRDPEDKRPEQIAYCADVIEVLITRVRYERDRHDLN